MGLSITEVPQAAVGEVQLAVGGKEHSRGTGRSGMWQGCTAASRAPTVPAGGLQTLSIKSRHCHAGCSKQALCHNHPLHLSPPHRARRTRSLRTVTRGFSMGSAQEGETGHC